MDWFELLLLLVELIVYFIESGNENVIDGICYYFYLVGLVYVVVIGFYVFDDILSETFFWRLIDYIDYC